jgi:hypothetical protein
MVSTPGRHLPHQPPHNGARYDRFDNIKKPSGISPLRGSRQQGATMTSKTSRRAVLAGAATLPALAIIPATAFAAADPIFAAIEKHRKLNDAHIAACNATVAASEGIEGLTPTIKKLEDQSGVACDVAFDALGELLATTPTTIAGCAALLRHVENLTGKGSFEQGGLFEDWCEEIEEPAKTMLSRVAATIDRAGLS